MATQLGTISIVLNDFGQTSRLDWISYESCTNSVDPSISEIGPFKSCLSSLFKYFEYGEPLKALQISELDMHDWSDFQKKVYVAILQIPHAETRSYLWVAKKCGLRGGAQAVGQALKKNPIPVFVPCHRIVPDNPSKLGGFMGKSDPQDPEMVLKKRLLNLEASYKNPVFSFLIPNTNGCY